LDVASLLLEAGSEVDARILSQQGAETEQLHGATPLYLACSSNKSGIVDLVDLLLISGADPNAHLLRGDPTITPLIAAIDRGSRDVIRSLLFGPRSPSDRPVTLAHRDPPDSPGSSSPYTQSPLLFAVVKGRADVAELLLSAGARCNLTILVQPKGSPPSASVPYALLDIARQRRDYDMLQVLSAHEECAAVAGPSEAAEAKDTTDRVRRDL
jgi:ankyrin repeat protein